MEDCFDCIDGLDWLLLAVARMPVVYQRLVGILKDRRRSRRKGGEQEQLGQCQSSKAYVARSR